MTAFGLPSAICGGVAVGAAGLGQPDGVDDAAAGGEQGPGQRAHARVAVPVRGSPARRRRAGLLAESRGPCTARDVRGVGAELVDELPAGQRHGHVVAAVEAEERDLALLGDGDHRHGGLDGRAADDRADLVLVDELLASWHRVLRVAAVVRDDQPDCRGGRSPNGMPLALMIVRADLSACSCSLPRVEPTPVSSRLAPTTISPEVSGGRVGLGAGRPWSIAASQSESARRARGPRSVHRVGAYRCPSALLLIRRHRAALVAAAGTLPHAYAAGRGQSRVKPEDVWLRHTTRRDARQR